MFDCYSEKDLGEGAWDALTPWKAKSATLILLHYEQG